MPARLLPFVAPLEPDDAPAVDVTTHAQVDGLVLTFEVDAEIKPPRLHQNCAVHHAPKMPDPPALIAVLYELTDARGRRLTCAAWSHPYYRFELRTDVDGHLLYSQAYQGYALLVQRAREGRARLGRRWLA